MMLLLTVGVKAQTADSQELAKEMNRRAEVFVKKAACDTVGDSVSVYRAVIDGVSYSLRCDEYDRMPNRKGEVKPKFLSANAKRLKTLHGRLIDAGRYFYEHKDREESQRAMKLYLKARESELLRDTEDASGWAAYYLALMDMEARSYQSADRLANIALKYDDTAQLGAEIKARCMGARMVTPQDSAKYLAVINKLYETDPNNDKYFAWIMQFYDRPQQRRKLEYFVDKELENNPNSIVPWILKGEIAMKAKRWEEAVDAYQHADEIDPSNIPVIYNIGVCLNCKALEEQEAIRQQGEDMTFDDGREITQILAEARTYLERVRSRDPRRRKVDWVKPLYMVYTVLGEKVKAEELAPLVSGFKR